MTITNATWPPTRAAAETRLASFIGMAGRQYRAERNFDRGPGQHTSVSGLSPYIRHRVVSEEEVLAAVLKQNSFSAAEKFVQEVYWRTYWKGWLEQRPGVWTHYVKQLEETLLEIQGACALLDLYQRAQQGQTGIEPFDAWAQELVATGYLHNHARMWFASIWIFTLKLPWVLGADFFLRHLLDGDPASNTLSWRWVAGLHTRGKTYLATANNIEKYAAGRFFAEGPPEGLTKLARRADALHEENLPPAVMPVMPEPTKASPGSGLLLTEEDLLLDCGITPQAIALWMPNMMRPQAASEQVQAFKTDIGRDALERAATRWPNAQVEPSRTVPQIVQWAEQQGLRQICMAYIPQGYVRAQQAELARALADKGCALQIFLREYDRLAWPHASKGFFHLKKQIPKMLTTLGLS